MSTHQISFAIRGMFCPKCAQDIERTLVQLDGVIAAQVNYATERATVTYNPARVTALKMVNAIRSIAFDTPVEHLTWWSEDLVYASAQHTVEKLMGSLEGVIGVAANLTIGAVTVDVIPGHGRLGILGCSFGGLRFRGPDGRSADARLLFLLRCGILALVEALVLWSAGAHAGWFASPVSLHAPLAIVVLSFFALFAIALPFYRFAYDAALQGEFDTSVILALVTSALAVISLPVGLMVPDARFVSLGFVAATTLTTGWFIWRALSIWVFPRAEAAGSTAKAASAAPVPMGVVSNESRH